MAKKILFIDINQAQTDFFKQGLVQHNYTVLSNSTDKDNSKLLEQEKPDLVLMGILQFDKEIYECFKAHDIPFIAVCDFDDLSCLDNILGIGAMGVLLAPININQLVIEIETALHFHYEKSLLNRRKDNMNTTIENNRKISLAIGLVMERYKINGEETFDVLRSAARSNQSRILDIANKLIKDHEKVLEKLNLTDLNGGLERPSNTVLTKIIETIKKW